MRTTQSTKMEKPIFIIEMPKIDFINHSEEEMKELSEHLKKEFKNEYHVLIVPSNKLHHDYKIVRE